jgi:hypothetical protein
MTRKAGTVEIKAASHGVAFSRYVIGHPSTAKNPVFTPCTPLDHRYLLRHQPKRDEEHPVAD